MKQRHDYVLQSLYEMFERDQEIINENFIVFEKGCYRLFGRFTIRPGKSGYDVLKNNSLQLNCRNLSSALGWCIAEKINNFSLSQEIATLDQQQSRLTDDISVADQSRRRSSNSEWRETVAVKIANKKALLKQVNDRLKKCINVTKYFQTKGFNDEIARTRRPAQNTANSGNLRKSNRQKNQV